MATTEVPAHNHTNDQSINPGVTSLATLHRKSDISTFLKLDGEREEHAGQIFNLGHRVSLDIKKPLILPERLVGKMLEMATPEEAEIVLKINEMLLDKRIVVNIGPILDQFVKKLVKTKPELSNGVVVLNKYNYVFTECDDHGGVARDIKKTLKTLQMNQNGEVVYHQLGRSMPSYLPIPFEGSKLDYGTWGRPAVIEGDFNNPELEINLSFLNVEKIGRFRINDKKSSGFWPTDITMNVQKVVSDSNFENGYALVTSLHTTVGINKMSPGAAGKLYGDLLKVAPDDPRQFYHNLLVRRGELAYRKDGSPAGDGNGQSHIWAVLIGSYTIVPVRNGKLVLGEDKSIMHHDCDTQPPRERGVVVSLIKSPENQVALRKS